MTFQVVDYAQLYAAAQAALDGKDDVIHALELQLSQAKEQAEAAEARALSAAEEKAAAEALSSRSRAGFESSVLAAVEALKRGDGGEKSDQAPSTHARTRAS